MLQFGMPTLIEIDCLSDTMELCKELVLRTQNFCVNF